MKERVRNDEQYYYIRNGVVCVATEDGMRTDDARWDSGNYYLTRKEAEDAIGIVPTTEEKTPLPKREKKDAIHPSHYRQYPIETIEMMRRIWGNEATKLWCIMTAFKYRMRLGHKDDVQQELGKEEFYLNYAAGIPDSASAADKIKAIKSAMDTFCSYEAMIAEMKNILL